MGERHNWLVVPVNSNVTTVQPGPGANYDLMNRTTLKFIGYGERDYGINLVWIQPAGPSNGHISFHRPGDGPGPLLHGEPFALSVAGGRYVRYRTREYGINLDWSDTPVYEWNFESPNRPAGAPVRAGEQVGLFNRVVGDVVFYDPRRYGINLKWLKDEGKFNDTPWYAEIVSMGWNFADEVWALCEELIQRGIGLADFALTLVGIMFPKRLRIRVVVLRDENGKALLGDERLTDSQRRQERQQIHDAVQVARETFWSQANTRIRAAGGVMIETLPFPAPEYALYVDCNVGAWANDVGSPGRYFRRHLARNPVTSRALLGYATPITVFVVKNITHKIGCSAGPLTNYVTVSLDGMDPVERKTNSDPRPSTLAHELGHSCCLLHSPNRAQLMFEKEERGRRMAPLERAIFRSSRHVTIF